jgi:hypothetical protein
MARIAAWLLGTLLVFAQTAVAPATVALATTWSDGRTTYHLTTAKRGVMWTPMFSRVDGYQPPDGSKPVYAVQFARVLVDGAIHVDVTVLLGSAAPPGVPVDRVVITPGARITVDALRKFGVQPVTLSMVTVAPMTPYLPTVVSVSPRIEIAQVEILNAPYPGYRLTLRNLGAQEVVSAHVQSYRGQERALSALKRSDDGRPMMTVGGTYTFDVNLTGGNAPASGDPLVWTPQPLDEIDIDAVTWSDGTHDGTQPYPQLDAIVTSDSGRRLQLGRIVEVLRHALDAPTFDADRFALLRSDIAALPDAEPDQLSAAQDAMRSVKAAIVADLARLSSTASADRLRERVAALLVRYEAWLKRISPP